MKALLLTLLLTTQASAAIYQGENIDGQWFQCRGVRTTYTYFYDEFTSKHTLRFGYEEEGDRPYRCKFTDRYIQFRNDDSGSIANIYLETDEITNPLQAFKKSTDSWNPEGKSGEIFYDSSYKIFIYFDE